MKKFFNVILSIIIFPIYWVVSYIFRIVIYDILGTILDIFKSILSFNILTAFLYIIAFPFILIWEIPVGLAFTFLVSIDNSSKIAKGETDISGAIAKIFTNSKPKQVLNSHEENDSVIDYDELN